MVESFTSIFYLGASAADKFRMRRQSVFGDKVEPEVLQNNYTSKYVLQARRATRRGGGGSFAAAPC